MIVEQLGEVSLVKAHESDAGFDLKASQGYELPSGKVTKISTGVKLNIPKGYFGLVLDRSSMGLKGLKVMGGVIDSGYIGEIFVCLAALNDTTINAGDKIAQIVFLPVPECKIVAVSQLSYGSKFDITKRGDSGFGSSGA